MIVDDGSTDETESVVKNWLKQKTPINMRYIKKENGGKHTAINYGVNNAIGKLFFIVDSDDFLVNNAVETILTDIKKIPLEGYVGIGYNRIFKDSTIIGSTFKGDYIDATALERSKYNIIGDKAEV